MNKGDILVYTGRLAEYKNKTCTLLRKNGTHKGIQSWVVMFEDGAEKEVSEKFLLSATKGAPTYKRMGLPSLFSQQPDQPAKPCEYSSAFEHEYKNGILAVNLTNMAKKFGKDVNEWFRLPSSQEYITELNMGKSHILYGKQRGAEGGTWSYDNSLTIEFARWLSPKFSIWCNRKIEELMQHGSTTLATPSYMVQDPIARAKAWIAEQEKAMLALETAKAEVKAETRQEVLLEVKPKLDIAELHEKSVNNIELGTFSNLLENLGIHIGRNSMFAWMRSHGYVVMRDGYNQPTQHSKDNGWMRVEIGHWTNPKTNEGMQSFKTVLTTKGQEYFIGKFKQIFPNSIKQ